MAAKKRSTPAGQNMLAVEKIRALVVRARAAEMLLLFARNALAPNAESGRFERAREDIEEARKAVADITHALKDIAGEDKVMLAEFALSASAAKIAVAEVRAA